MSGLPLHRLLSARTQTSWRSRQKPAGARSRADCAANNRGAVLSDSLRNVLTGPSRLMLNVATEPFALGRPFNTVHIRGTPGHLLARRRAQRHSGSGADRRTSDRYVISAGRTGHPKKPATLSFLPASSNGSRDENRRPIRTLSRHFLSGLACRDGESGNLISALHS
jgi:hypothetical protein